jgi:hypothetical protein
MLAGGADPFYRSILSAAHQRYLRVDVYSGDGLLLNSQIPEHFRGDPEGGLVIMGGSVTANLGNRVARNAMVQVPFDLYPVEPTDLLAPFGNELRITMGVRLDDGSAPYTWPVFRGMIRNVEANSNGMCVVQCADRASEVVDALFVSPQNSQPLNTINQEWQRLIVDALPDATFGLSDVFDRLVQPLTWELDRAAALDEMAMSVGALWYPLAPGEFVIRRYPWTVLSPAVITLTDQLGGTVLGWSVERSRDSIFNVVTVTGERLNGDTPVYATASDTTPGSPTSLTGNFGVRSRLERLQTPSTQGGAQSAAEALLRTYVAPTEEWRLEVVPDPSQELGDTVLVQVNGRSELQVVKSFSLPLNLSGDMTISTRSIVVGGAQ